MKNKRLSTVLDTAEKTAALLKGQAAVIKRHGLNDEVNRIVFELLKETYRLSHIPHYYFPQSGTLPRQCLVHQFHLELGQWLLCHNWGRLVSNFTDLIQNRFPRAIPLRDFAIQGILTDAVLETAHCMALGRNWHYRELA